ncbi:MAG: hypothetical protein J6Q53_06480 [Oscillospiraceae bacterium]|nr:hypothetical protein [Oscillospiraceae bacterium]
MRDNKQYLIWGVLFILCAGLGFIPEPEGLIKAIMVLVSFLFFVPPGWLLYRAVRSGNRQGLCCLRNLSAISLGLTLVLLVVNFLSVGASEAVGNYLYGLLVIFSAPMVCSQFWAVSLFLWACLMMTALTFLREKKD